MSQDLRCPTCRVPWRGIATCPRCGSDLAMLMRVAARAWELREAARQALNAGDDPAEGLRLAQAACRLHATARGKHLVILALLCAGRFSEAGAPLQNVLEGEFPGPHGTAAQ